MKLSGTNGADESSAAVRPKIGSQLVQSDLVWIDVPICQNYTGLCTQYLRSSNSNNLVLYFSFFFNILKFLVLYIYVYR